MLTNADIAELTDWRRDLHRHPEISGQEAKTAATVTAALRQTQPDQLLQNLGGHGIAAIYQGAAAGPTVLFRAELDGLPIAETATPDWRSTIPGKGHMCGHDGHMTILMGLARRLHRRRPATGRVILLFQPAEENGTGAAAVLADPRYSQITPDYAFALHNMPGLPLGHATLRTGTMMCASEGLLIRLTGKTAHASMPETGTSPIPAITEMIPRLLALGPGGPLTPDFRMVTITHIRAGEPAFGITPGEASLHIKLRTREDGPMAALHAEACALITAIATAHHLTSSFEIHDHFSATLNDAPAVARLTAAMEALHIPHSDHNLPIRASEDFGRFASPQTQAAMMFLGSGETHPQLHNPDYDFPDSLTPLGAHLFYRVAQDILG